jgi:YHS domain-containing protein
VLLRALLIFLLFVFLARAVWRLLEGVVRGARGGAPGAGGRPGGQAPAAVKMAQCPVCGTYIVPAKALTGVSRGQVLYYCSETCRGKHAA